MKILQILSMYHQDGEKILRENAEVLKLDRFDKQKVIAILKEKQFDGIALRAPAKIDQEIIDAGSDLKVIAGAGIGLDNIDVEYATKKGIAVLHAPKVNSDSTAEHAVALIFGLLKNIIPFHMEMENGNFQIRDQLFTYELKNKKIGLVGFGTIAQKVAKICSAIGMDVSSYVRNIDSKKEKIAEEIGVSIYTDIKKIFKDSDIVSVHIPLTVETKEMIDKKLLLLMKPTSYIINTSRGAVIKEEDLYEILSQQKIAGAGLDVFSVEPPDKNNPLFQLKNIILTPHVGGISEEAAKLSSTFVAQSVIQVLEGESVDNIANPEVLKFKS